MSMLLSGSVSCCVRYRLYWVFWGFKKIQFLNFSSINPDEKKILWFFEVNFTEPRFGLPISGKRDHFWRYWLTHVQLFFSRKARKYRPLADSLEESSHKKNRLRRIFWVIDGPRWGETVVGRSFRENHENHDFFMIKSWFLPQRGPSFQESVRPEVIRISWKDGLWGRISGSVGNLVEIGNGLFSAAAFTSVFLGNFGNF